MRPVAGIDGCRAGWVVVVLDAGNPASARLSLVRDLEALFAAEGGLQVAAVDMPIGLPDKVAAGGRVAERAVRPLLGARQSSVFSVPSRRAVMTMDYGQACREALATSDPPRKVSRQCFHLFPKIREIDALLDRRPDLDGRLFESHPEVAFAVLSGRAMTLPKKVKGVPNPPGLAERRAMLAANGFHRSFLEGPAPRGAGADDVIDATVLALVALRLAAGTAIPHPAEAHHDERGRRIAIWT